jgi:hypothetical protein
MISYDFRDSGFINYDAAANIERELRDQYAIQQQAGYSYKNPADLDRIFSAQAAKLAAAGVQSIYDIGTSVETTGIQQPGYKPTVSEMTSVVDKGLLGGFDQPTQVKTTFLINKRTGEKIPEVDLPSNWETADISEFKFKEPLKLAVPSDSTYYRYDKDTSVEGQADYGLEFVDGLPVFRPYYKGTTSDPGLLFAATALVASGLPILAEAALSPEAVTAYNPMAGAEYAFAPEAATAGGISLLEGAQFPAEGIQATASTAPSATAPFATPTAATGFQASAIPGLSAMGGAQGLTIPVAGGTITGGGLIPAGAPIPLGGGSELSLLDAARGLNTLQNLTFKPPEPGQQPITRPQSQFSLPAPKQTVVGLLPLAERYRRSLI